MSMTALADRLIYGDLAPFAVAGAVFLGVVALLFAARFLLAPSANVTRERARRVAGSRAEELPPAAGGARRSGSPGALQQVLASFTKLGRPTDDEQLGRLRSRLTQAGLRGELAMLGYLSSKMALALILGALGFYLSSRRGLPLRTVGLATVAAMMLGHYLPALWLHLRVQKRQAEINHTLPDALDLVVTCVEAGLGLDAALDRVREETQLSSSLLAAELEQASLEMRAGMPRGDAFRRMANRTGVEELHNLAALIIQTDAFGTSVSTSLRVQANAMRVRRTQIAEERAAKVAVKLTVPLVFCILPALFAVLMGPAVVRIYQVLLPVLRGGH